MPIFEIDLISYTAETIKCNRFHSSFCIFRMSLENKELTLQFIEDYREREILWNSSKKDYCNKQLREGKILKVN